MSYARELMALEASWRIRDLEVVETLVCVTVAQGFPERIESDIRPESIMKDVDLWDRCGIM